MHLLNEETLFISWHRSDIKEVNDWALNNFKIRDFFLQDIEIVGSDVFKFEENSIDIIEGNAIGKKHALKKISLVRSKY